MIPVNLNDPCSPPLPLLGQPNQSKETLNLYIQHFPIYEGHSFLHQSAELNIHKTS